MFRTKRNLDIPAFGDAHLATREEMEAAGLFAEKGIRLGYHRSPNERTTWGRVVRYNGDGGLILVAPPRSGKARDVLVGALLEHEQSVIVVDPKGQLAAITKARREQLGQQVVVLNPFHVWPEILGPTARYNPMALLDTSSPTFGAECRKLAEGLIAKSSNERDSHWTDGARTLVSSVIGHLAMDEDSEYRNLAQMREIIAGSETVLTAFAKSASKSPHAFIRQGLAEYAIENAPNKAEIAGKISTAREQTFFLSIDTIADNIRGDDFRFGVLKNEPVTVYVILPDEHLDTCGKWFRLVVASALHDLWRGGRGAYRVLAILDEFAHIGHLDILEKAAGMAAGHGLQLWPVLQNLTQLRKDYGENWETFIAGSEIRQFFGTRDQTSAKYVSETSGQRTVMTAGQSVQNTKPLEHGQSSDSVGQAGQPLIRPHEISGFGPNESLIFGPRNIVIDGLRRPYFHTPEFAGLYGPDPQHKADTMPPPAVRPEDIVTFGDTHAAIEQKASEARTAQRPFALRLLVWGKSSNPLLDAIRKAEYVFTLPFRLVGAMLSAPFAIHNRPLGALLGFLAVFGFWELWNSFAKEPLLSVYDLEQKTCTNQSYVADNSWMGHTLGCKTEALKKTVAFFWAHVAVAVFRSGPSKAAIEFDKAYGQEVAQTNNSYSAFSSHVAANVTGAFDPAAPRPPHQLIFGDTLAVNEGVRVHFFPLNPTQVAEVEHNTSEYGSMIGVGPETGRSLETLPADAKVQAVLNREKKPAFIRVQIFSDHAALEASHLVRLADGRIGVIEATARLHSLSEIRPPLPPWSDPDTNLVWMGRDNGWDLSWDEANDYCKSREGGRGGWRLPSVSELSRLNDRSASPDQIKGIKLTTCCVWLDYPQPDHGEVADYNFLVWKRTIYSSYVERHALCVRGNTTDSH